MPLCTVSLMSLPFMVASYLISFTPDGSFEPWTCEWQLTQEPASRNPDGLPPGRPAPVRATLGCPTLRVTLLAQQRRPLHEQRWMDGAVRRVTIRAVLRNRRVLPQERTALLRVAGVAGLIQRGLEQELRRHGPMNLVAGVAGHLRKAHWMHRRLVELRTLALVAGVTDLRLLSDRQNWIVRCVNLVAARAGDSVPAVRTTLPGDTVLILMATETDLVLLLDRHPRVRRQT